MAVLSVRRVPVGSWGVGAICRQRSRCGLTVAKQVNVVVVTNTALSGTKGMGMSKVSDPVDEIRERVECMTEQQRAAAWCQMNSWDWPSALATLKPTEWDSLGERERMEIPIVKEIWNKLNKLPLKVLLKEWNKDRMSPAEFEEWWENRQRRESEDRMSERPTSAGLWEREGEVYLVRDNTPTATQPWKFTADKILADESMTGIWTIDQLPTGNWRKITDEQSDSSIYTKHVDYRFEVKGEGLAIKPFTHDGRGHLEIEETRKNGQEDCHMYGMLMKVDGKWQWKDGGDSFDQYGDAGLSDAIAEFLNDNPPPT
jgi:hypothetical protein